MISMRFIVTNHPLYDRLYSRMIKRNTAEEFDVIMSAFRYLHSMLHKEGKITRAHDRLVNMKRSRL